MLLRPFSAATIGAVMLMPLGCASSTETGSPVDDTGIEVVGAEDDGDPIPENKLMFDCKPGKSAPHPLIQILKVELPPDEIDPDEQDVVIETNNVEEGTAGICSRRPFEDDPTSVRFACVSTNERLRIYWPADAQGGAKPPTTTAQVEIREAWLFWTKNYTATCEFKTL